VKQQYHKTVKLKGWQIEDGEDIDKAIQEVLEIIAQQKGTIHLIDFKIYQIDTQPLLAHRETFLTVMAEEGEL
jgi:hypothetical protein